MQALFGGCGNGRAAVLHQGVTHARKDVICNAQQLPKPHGSNVRNVPGMYLLPRGVTSCKPGYLVGDAAGPIRAGAYKAVKDRCYAFSRAHTNGG